MIEVEMDGIIDIPTLSDVIVRHQQNPSLTATRRRDLVSAVIRMSEMTGADLGNTPASLQLMRPLIKAVRPAQHDLTLKTWANLRSNFRAALVQPVPQERKPANPEWGALRAALPDKRMRIGLTRFISFCEDQVIAPKQVCDAVSDRFRTHLEADTQVPDPHACHRITCRVWNKAVETVSGWPQLRLSLPDYSRPRQSTPITSFPLSLQDEFASYIGSLRGGDLFAEKGAQKALALSTVRQRGVELGLALSALVDSGREPASITSLACLVEPDAFTTILRRYLRDQNTPRPFAHNLAWTLISLARRWVRLDPVSLGELDALRKCLGDQPKRLTEKNRTLLNTLEDPAVRAKLFVFPERLANWAEHAPPVRSAIAMQIAIAVAILQHAPLRIANLAELRLDRHLMRPGGPRSLWQVDIPPDEVKNDQALTYELPRRVTALLDRYNRRFRPSLAERDNQYLFPVGSTHKCPHALSQQIRQALADWVGIHMTPHQFRHFAGRLMQQHSPGAFGAIAQLLGQRDERTAIRYYSGLDTLSAGRHFDAILEAERNNMRLRGRR
jgi:integrase